MALRSVIYRTHGSHIHFNDQTRGRFSLDQVRWNAMPPSPDGVLPDRDLLNNSWSSSQGDADTANGVLGFVAQDDGTYLVKTHNRTLEFVITGKEYATIVEGIRLYKS